MTASSPLNAFLDVLKQSLGPGAISADSQACREYGHHTLPEADHIPSAILFPSSTTDVETIVRHANSFGVPLFPISMGRNLGLGSRAPMRSGQVVVDLGRRMNRVIEINEELGYCVVEPGVTFNALYEALQSRGSALMMSPTAGPPDGSLLGNALDKGGGSGPAGDHFGNVCGMEVVLGNGDTIRTGDGGLDVPSHPNWHVTKYSFGPALDGLFTQSNYGIVTRIGIWLNQKPTAIRPFFFTFPDDDDLREIIELIRAMKKRTLVPTLIRATNDLYLLSSQERHPRSGQSTVHPLSLAERRALQQRYGVGSWTVSGALYGGSDEALAPGISALRAHFEASGKARYIAYEEAQAMPQLHAAINSNSGRPADGELGMLKWRPGGGAIWLTPGAPMDGQVVNEFQRQCREIAVSNGLDYMASFVCGPRFARSVHAIIYDRDKAEEAERADRCYRAMCEAFRGQGIFVGRAPTQYQAFHQSQRTPEVVKACAAIKRALDPNGIIAPGRYGIE
ncbi:MULTISPECIES: FAD-binding oxidoreductase [unclassified Beijerinckia]|uniref:FAD-binding oxidoreductase n=1 Tax=unclassified Beijerinckia TaxID=2638183 RepID=UPI000B829FAB|nr:MULTISPECIES: FAD-binding oxidoreductase [unclassified Beijerinckia]